MLPRTRSTRRVGVVRTVFSIASNSALSASGSRNGLSGRVEHRHAALGQQEAHRTVHLVQPPADPLAEGAVLVARRAHQRDVGIVDDEFPARGTFPAPCRAARNSPCRARRPNRHRAGRCGSPRRNASSSAGNTPPTSMSATSVVVMSRNAGEQAGVAQPLHGAAADAGGVENQAVVVGFKALRHRLHAGRRHAEHGDADGRARQLAPGLARVGARQLGDHAGHRVRGVAEHLPR